MSLELTDLDIQAGEPPGSATPALGLPAFAVPFLVPFVL